MQLFRKQNENVFECISSKEKGNDEMVITISREYGSGGKYVGRLLAEKLNLDFYSVKKKFEDKTNTLLEENKELDSISSKGGCVIVSRFADYILKDNKNAIHIFLYNEEENKVKRATKYYGLGSRAHKIINKINKIREENYKNFTGRNWKNLCNYDLIVDVDKYGVENTVNNIINYIENIKDKNV